MHRTLLSFLLIVPSLVCAEEISFNRDIQPLLADRCFSCHGPDSASRKADLRLDIESEAKTPLDKGDMAPINPGNPELSSIIVRMTHPDPDELMPPPKSKILISESEIATLRQWIKEGAKWERHWSFIPPAKSPAPGNEATTWPRGEIDHFVLDTLTKEGLQPSPPADPATLLRRVSFDLTGLPPTIEELDGFLTNPSDAAYEAAVDRLLASPAFGERMALDWLDIARYGDTDGLFEDHPRSIYPWRDWVVGAFNQNLSYRDFISWQVAGDLYPNATTEQKLATGFLRNNPTSNEGGIIDEDYRVKYVVDRVNTTATAFLGLTLECAQCHDHKFDPMSQQEYFEFSGFFNSLVGKGNTKGTTAPFLSVHSRENETRLAEIGEELKAVEAALKETPPELLAAHEKWEKDAGQPVRWNAIAATDQPKEEATPASPKSKIAGQFVRISLAPEQVGFITISEVEIYSGGQNVALAGKATQSSVGYSSPAGKALDGDRSGAFKSCSCTNSEKNAWWEVDLGSEVAIDHIVVYNRNDCCPERLDKVDVQILNASRKPVSKYNTGDAPFRSLFTANPGAPAPPDKTLEYQRTFAQKEAITALRFSGETPGLIESLKIEVIGKGKPKLVATVDKPNFKVGANTPSVVGLKAPLSLAADEKLRLTIKGPVFQIETTANQTAVARATLSTDPKERLAYFQSTWGGFADERARRDALSAEKAKIDKLATVSMIAVDEARMRPTYLLERGEYDKRGAELQPSAPGSIMPYDPALPRNRLGLAQWLVDPENPLTARVAVNRYWQMIFGIGLVKTSEDFGTQGDRPSNTALLDTLAVDFMESDWDLKRLLRRIITSATYRQASRHLPALYERDPENRLLARGTRRRLPAEFLRDHALATSGLLVRKQGGPGVHPYQPAVLFGANAIGSSKAKFTQSSGENLYRRSLYTYWKRQIPAANMRILGADGRTACRTRRETTNTPLQALVMLNDPQFVEAARVLAERAMKEGGATPQARIAFAFRLATSREPKTPELVILHEEYKDRHQEFTADPEQSKAYLNGGGERKPDPALNQAELAAFAAVSSLILNLDESISKN